MKRKMTVVNGEDDVKTFHKTVFYYRSRVPVNWQWYVRTKKLRVSNVNVMKMQTLSS